ncbi:MAG: hypothetical protein LQ343_007628 [Gyalolechia ehrenbergii]|nr:MAG: hypothetical protein LQ343_007628 [Gyalolechia ehrenbergii]
MKAFAAVGGSLCLAATALATDLFNEASYPSGNVIKRDFVVVGGGASGTYAAVGLHDQGKSFILIERSGRLGGQTETYTEPSSGTKVDYGVQAYNNISLTRDFFARFNVPVTEFTFPPAAEPVYADFTTGAVVEGFKPGTLGSDYTTELNKYPYLDGGFFLPDKVPEDLLLPWGEYVEKYSLQDSTWATTVARPAPPGNLLEILAIYVFHAFNALEVSLGQGRENGLQTANYDNSEVYENAYSELKANVLLNSTVIAARRSSSRKGGVQLVVKTATGYKLVIAKQLILGVQPVLDTMKPFGLDSKEQSILSKLRGYPYYAGLVSNTGLSNSSWYTNVAAKTPYNVPNLPDFTFFKPTLVEGQFLYWYSALQPTSRAQIESEAVSTINKLHAIAGTKALAKPRFDAFADHTPFHVYVTAEDITNGFYRDLYSLQGYKNTWYISATFARGSSQIWNNTANMLPEIIAAAG